MSALRATADLSSLHPMRDHALAHARKSGLSIELEPKLDLVLEEILVNVASHAYGGEAGEVELECEVTNDEFCCTVRDWGIPFNPLAQDEPDTTQPLNERPIGGLGLLFVTTMPNSCSYRRNGEANELTFCFSL